MQLVLLFQLLILLLQPFVLLLQFIIRRFQDALPGLLFLLRAILAARQP